MTKAMSEFPYELQQQKENPAGSHQWEGDKKQDPSREDRPDWLPEPGPTYQAEDDGKESGEWESGKPKKG